MKKLKIGKIWIWDRLEKKKNIIISVIIIYDFIY